MSEYGSMSTVALFEAWQESDDSAVREMILNELRSRSTDVMAQTFVSGLSQAEKKVEKAKAVQEARQRARDFERQVAAAWAGLGLELPEGVRQMRLVLSPEGVSVKATTAGGGRGGSRGAVNQPSAAERVTYITGPDGSVTAYKNGAEAARALGFEVPQGKNSYRDVLLPNLGIGDYEGYRYTDSQGTPIPHPRWGWDAGHSDDADSES